MNFARPLIRGRLLRRYKRFLADVELEDGATVTAHCPNPGAMTGLDAPGSQAWVEPNDSPTRKLKHTLKLVRADGVLVGIDTGVPNPLVAEALEAGALPRLTGYSSHRREVRYGRASRIDFLLEAPGRPPAYVEIKNIHLMRAAGLAEFPDCVTKRGAKHLVELAEMARGGARAVMLYIVQRDDCDRFALAADIDPDYAARFEEARVAGVEAYAHTCRVAPEGVDLSREIPIVA